MPSVLVHTLLIKKIIWLLCINVMQIYTQRKVLMYKISEQIFTRFISQSNEHDSIFCYKINTYYYGILPRKICFAYRIMLGKILNQNSINF